MKEKVEKERTRARRGQGQVLRFVLARVRQGEGGEEEGFDGFVIHPEGIEDGCMLG